MQNPSRKLGPDKKDTMDVLPIPKPSVTDNLSSFPLVFVYRILVSGIGCFFHGFSCFNFNPVMKNSS